MFSQFYSHKLHTSILYKVRKGCRFHCHIRQRSPLSLWLTLILHKEEILQYWKISILTFHREISFWKLVKAKSLKIFLLSNSQELTHRSKQLKVPKTNFPKKSFWKKPLYLNTKFTKKIWGIFEQNFKRMWYFLCYFWIF